jgi:hypothetical protein
MGQYERSAKACEFTSDEFQARGDEWLDRLALSDKA